MALHYKEFQNDEHHDQSANQRAINFAGVVGAGKSTICELMESDYKVFYEPVVDNDLLELFYADQKQHSFSMQIFFLNKRFAMYKEAQEHKKTLFDRSIVEDRIFARMLRDQGKLDPTLYDLYQELFDNMLEHVQPPDLMVYLRIKVDNAIERIKTRGRVYELDQPHSYWQDLHKYYADFFETYDWSPLLTIDVDNKDFLNNPDDRIQLLTMIEEHFDAKPSKSQINGYAPVFETI